MGGQYLKSIQTVMSLRALILILGIGLASSHDIYPEGEELKPDVHEFKRSVDQNTIRIMKKANNNEIRIMKKANDNNEIRIMKKANNQDDGLILDVPTSIADDMSKIRVMRDLEGQHLIRAVRSYLDNTNRVIRVMKKRASGDTAAASDDSDKIRVMRSSDGILQLLPPLKLDKKFKRGQNHRSGGKQHPAFGNTGGEDRRKMIEIKEVEVIPRDENLHRLWRRNFKKDPRELRIMKKSYIGEDYL